MADIFQNNEIKGLNEILKKLRDGKELTSLNDFPNTDIVFVAGLFLWYKQYKKYDIEIQGLIRRSDYFEQLEKLYGFSHNQIFEEEQFETKIYSPNYIPPIYITEKTLDCFFKDDKENIMYVMNKYKDNFDILDFIDKRTSNYQNSIKKFSEYEIEIKQRLEKFSPIFTFIFIVASKNLATKKDEAFDDIKDYVEKLWYFTQDYVHGLYELAKNIVEHSGKDGQKGEGMIVIHTDINKTEDNANKNNRKNLKTHIFDYGVLGIIPKLKEYTQKHINEIDDTKLSPSQKKVRAAYIEDFKLLNSDFTLTKFIESQTLAQQTFRHIGHYGINKLYRLIRHPLEGEMFIASRGINEEQEYFNENAENFTLKIGTHYFIKISFIPENFKKLDKPIYMQQEFSTLGSSEELKEFMEKKIILLDKLNELKKEEVNLDNFTGILDITIDKKINKEFMDNVDFYFSKLSKHKQKYVVALNLENCLDGESNLLRFFGHLVFEYEQPFVIYNLEFETYKKMVDDNKAFAIDRNWESFWHETKGMLIFSKIQYKEKEFYFADILYGKLPDDYYSVNKMLDHTFPNSASIVDNEIENASHINNINLPVFFNNNVLLPYDILLKSKKKELTFINIETILQNELLPYKENNNTSYTPTELLKNRIDDFNGYHIPNTHFSIGNKIHTSNFYYAKRLFQNSFYTVRLAIYLAKEIHNNILKFVENFTNIITEEINHIPDSDITIETLLNNLKNNVKNEKEKYIIKAIENAPTFISDLDKGNNGMFQGKEYSKKNLLQKIGDIIRQVYTKEPITLMGYEMYSELLLSLIEKFLNDIYKYEVNHFVTRNEENKLNFLPKDTFESYLDEYDKRKTIIIVPIAATGSTAKKIEKNIKNYIYEYKKNVERMNDEDTRERADDCNFITPYYNILWAKPEDEKFEEYIERENQAGIINLPVQWFDLHDCPLCYGPDQKETKPLFDTDNSSLTPTLIFGNPKGKTKSKQGNEVESNVEFNKLNFKIKYQSVARNNNYRIYDIDPDEFIKGNKPEIVNWLKNTVGAFLKKELNPTDKVVIVAPCHESNSQFINLINEHVFSSAATIIHHQSDVDFVENFKMLNKSYLTDKNIKIFYVDDVLITGKHFFELFDLIREVTENSQPLTASIFINDQAIPFVHDRAVHCSKNYFAFITYNQPPTLNMLSPLEYERIRYESLQGNTLHDTLCEHFRKKANRLNPQKAQSEELLKKQIRRLKMFEATHKIYDYFAKNDDIPESIENIVNFQLNYEGGKDNNPEDKDMNRKALLKVLSQYPFILYKNLKMKTFEWHKYLLSKIPTPNEDPFNIEKDYDDAFSTFKFHLRRATFLGNYQVLDEDFLEKLLTWFYKIDLKKDGDEKNLCNFPIFALGNYIEMIEKNAWVAYHILKNIKPIEGNSKLREKIEKSNQSRRFFRMLKIEIASLIEGFVKMIEKDYRIQWRDMFRYDDEEKSESSQKFNDKLITKTKKIVDFFDEKQELLKTNDFLIVKKIFLNDTDDWKKEDTPFVNYLWVKQLLYADCMDKDSHIPKGINYQEKIDAIIDKMKGFFLEKEKVLTFFIVTDGQKRPHVLKDEQNLLYNFCEEFDIDKQIKDLDEDIKISKTQNNETQDIITFLNGDPTSVMKNVPKTAVEFVRKKDGKWEDIYDDKTKDVKFIKDSECKWLYLIRISKLNEDDDRKCKFETQGLFGFYSKEDLKDNLLPKQLLMLLRKDMSKFIEKHHKNDEFSALRQAELTKRLAYLAGHGRQTMQRLALDDPKTFGNTVETMEKLQYLFALKLIDYSGNTEGHKKNINKTLFSIFFKNYLSYEDLEKYVKDIAEKIYDSEIVENKVALDKSNIFEKPNCTNENDKIKINGDILKMICFELVINAKKNRWNEENEEKVSTNKLTIFLEQQENYILIKAKNIGPEIYTEIRRNINEGKPIKEDYELSGLDLIREVSKFYNGTLSAECNCIDIGAKKYENTIIVKLNRESD